MATGKSGWPRRPELVLWSLLFSFRGSCSGKDEYLCVYCVAIFFWQYLHLLPALGSALCGLDSLHGAGRRVSVCGTPGLCLSATKYVVTFPLQLAIPSCLWRGLLAPLGMTTERAAVCQPPPEPTGWACCLPVVGRVPETADFTITDIYHSKATSQMTLYFLASFK